jgi:hypothetical protein
MKIDGGLWRLWAKGCAVGNAERFPRQAPRFAEGELSTISTTRFLVLPGFGAIARFFLGPSSPSQSSERRTGFSLKTRTVAWAIEPAFLQGWVR